MILAMQVVGLFFGIWFTSVNVGKIVYREYVSEWNFIIMSSGWTLFIMATWFI